jgi:hypothetical protein
MKLLGKKISQFSPRLKNNYLFYILIPAFLCACAGDSSKVVYDTFKLGVSSPNTLIDQTPLNPNFRYLKVEANGQPALLVLGYVDTKNNTQHDVWYSAFKEAIEINRGRLANTEGLAVNWTGVRTIDAPALKDALVELKSSDKRVPKFRYTRIRTVMPGYQVNIRETVIMEALLEVPRDAPAVFQDPKFNADIRWVQETVLVPAQTNNPTIKPLRAIYALNTKTHEVVYGKQDLTENFYISWLQWPYPAKSKSN